MEGLVSGNGPINWLPGMSTPQPNPFTWLNLTNVVWVDQPLGVGYSQGEPDIEDEEELAMQFAGFWKKFVQLFRLENWRTYLTGESYAGVYIPYIADAVSWVSGFFIRQSTLMFQLLDSSSALETRNITTSQASTSTPQPSAMPTFK